ncbi:ATP-binding protein [Streptomyces wuyuanensis]|uniref:histidine kinase n=1 Tax=Streptomyces wuyuanensis TaxID=1196353 RepID=A0A1G9R852_9ACTN|nr:ATP-binding protein [Streptomyces wuyuanensis]SDM19469.1 Sensor histidine kinase regulating citrate/malate metabolism [Streptomyces wuyuanensis]
MRIPRPRSLAGQLFAMQVVLVAAIVAGFALFSYVTDRAQAEETARRQTTATATAVADFPSVVTALRSADPTAHLQPHAERLRKDAGVDFVVIMSPDGRRWTHPEPGEIGHIYLGHIDEARRGHTVSETYTGTLGPSVRTVAPVRDGSGRIVALVSAGITIDKISEQLGKQVTALLGMASAALALGGLGTYVINARLRRHTHGMNAAELSRMHDYHEATLHAVREGLLMLDGHRRIALINDGARELLGLGGDVVGRGPDELGLPPALTGALLASEPRVDELHLTADRVLVVSTQPVVGGERRGTVVTLRDHTELQSLTGELDSERGFTQALRAQAHEAANRLHTVVSLIELGRADEAVDFATAELELAQVLTDRVVSAVGEPVLAALLLGKAAQANESGVELVLTDDSRIDDGVLPPWLPPRDLVTILGNLIDNAVEASSAPPPVPREPASARAEGRLGDGPASMAVGASATTARRGAQPSAGPDTAGSGARDAAGRTATVPGARSAARHHAEGFPISAPGTRDVPGADGSGEPRNPDADAPARPRTPEPGSGTPGTRNLPGTDHGQRTAPADRADGSGAAVPGARDAAGPPGRAHEAPPTAARSAAAREGAPTAATPARAAGARPRVVVTARTDEDELVLRVSDTGPGLGAEDAEAVFERGWSTRGPGRGLGLALVRQAAHRGRGTVEAAQGPYGGAEFTVRLPLRTTEVDR